MHELLPFVLALIGLVVLIEMFASKIKVAYPILLVVAGLAISCVPGLPPIHIDPNMIFFIFLPPLLFEAAWSISLKELKKWYRIIGSFAFIVVFFTAISVAVFTNYFIPGFSLALGFLLGGIVSPPDAVSTGAILKFVKVPKSTSSILEGESLLNDASSLIIFRFAMVAVATGQFIWSDAILSFSWMILGGAVIGLVLAWLFVQAHKRLPTDAPSDIVFTLIEPYALYWVAEQLHSSGVLAVVFGGLYLSNRRMVFLNSTSRVKGFSVWESFVFILNGIVFMLIGLDMPEIVNGLKEKGIPLSTAIQYGVGVTVILIVVRIIASFGALISTFLFRREIFKRMNPKGMWMRPFMLGWTGMRGVVSLASAFAIPIQLNNGLEFPHRSLILFITFVVILLTLIVQGLTLPYILKRTSKFFVDEENGSEKIELDLKRSLYAHSVGILKNKYTEQLLSRPLLASTLNQWEQKMKVTDEEIMDGEHRRIYIELLEHQRTFILEQNKNIDLDEDIVRKQLYLIDLEEEKIKNM
ncbi:sodium/proton antiporter, CPA1 family [Mucilaginibacter pineti]|uniref:Sodium/proton antiporter, CPA1 family n=1 Tax=Mucilaginibacter pineti TaxID=1391627 RepID=A0A1G6TLD4_9SPHI|nr:Na+/H+ antiporter [Mucilaginibacter pineti]SDD30002.1 sodium/proton antiporter, CPA1 family [Mucilaginibacter pineti]